MDWNSAVIFRLVCPWPCAVPARVLADVCHLGKSGEPGGRAFLLVSFIFVSESQ